jgi:23S rRNA (adenine2030-N6)-methyltransferase
MVAEMLIAVWMLTCDTALAYGQCSAQQDIRYALYFSRSRMNYRHAFHAGNHGDVLKHVVLARIIELLKSKDKAFSVLDAHAGIGAYDLEGVEALKTGEWQGGVGKMAEVFLPEVEVVLAAYRSVLAAMGSQRFYPGSPELALRLIRNRDKLIANELHPVDVETLRENYAHDSRVRVTHVDAMQSVKAELPFVSRRGVILIDPPYEVLDETDRTVKAVAFGHRRFATGCFVIWYPITTEEFAAQFVAAVQALVLPNMLRAELRVKEAFSRGGLSGSGLIIVNPPWNLESDLTILLPALATRLGIGSWGRGHVDWLTPPK